MAVLAIEKGLAVIGLIAKSDSALAQKSSILLILSVGEAPLRSAATVSLTAQLYVVDVLFLTYAAKN